MAVMATIGQLSNSLASCRVQGRKLHIGKETLKRV